MPGKRFTVETVFRAQDRFSRPMGRMQRRISRVTRSIERGLRSVDRVTSRVARGLGRGLRIGAAAATVAVTGLYLAVDRLTASNDDLAKQSRRLDFPIEDLQEFQFAAEQTGVEGDVFRKGLDKFAKTLGELKGGFGSMETGLKKLDPGLRKQLKNTENTSEAFQIYLKAMRDIKDPAKQAALGALAFGRSGMKMVNMANLTEDQLKALRAEMRENGLVTMDQAKAAEEYRDAMNSLKLAGGGLIRDILTPLIPLMTKAAKWVRQWAIDNRELIKTRILEWGQKVVDNWSDIVGWAKTIGKSVAVFLTLAGVLKVLIGILTVVNAVMAANPIGLIAAAVVAIVAAVTAAFVFGEKLKKMFDDLPKPIKALLAVLFPLMGPLAWMIAAAVAIKTKWGSLKAFLVNVWKRVDTAVTAATEGIKNAAVAVVNAWFAVKNFFIDLWNGIVDVFETAVNFLMTTGPISWFLFAVSVIKANWGQISEFFTMVWESVAAVFSAGVEVVKSIVGPVIGWFKETWESIMGTADAAVMTAVESGAFAKMLEIIGVLKEAWGDFKNFLSETWDSIVDTAKVAVDRILKFISPVTDFFKSIETAKNRLIGEQIGFLGSEDVEREGQRAERGEGFLPSVVTPDERVSRSIEESRRTETSEVIIKDETGRAEIKAPKGKGPKLVPSGAY